MEVKHDLKKIIWGTMKIADITWCWYDNLCAAAGAAKDSSLLKLKGAHSGGRQNDPHRH